VRKNFTKSPPETLSKWVLKYRLGKARIHAIAEEDLRGVKVTVAFGGMEEEESKVIVSGWVVDEVLGVLEDEGEDV